MDPQVFTYKHTSILMKYNPKICVKSHFLLKKKSFKIFSGLGKGEAQSIYTR